VLFDLFEVPVDRVPTEALEMRVWELRHNVSAYDAAYVALAERTGFELWTRDRKLAGAPGTECVFRVFESD
jgi:predicted nucleic acid-binding protein